MTVNTVFEKNRATPGNFSRSSTIFFFVERNVINSGYDRYYCVPLGMAILPSTLAISQRAHRAPQYCTTCLDHLHPIFSPACAAFSSRARLPRIQVQVRVKSGVSVTRVVVVGGSYAGVELSCNLATELQSKGLGKVEITLATNSEVSGGKQNRGRRCKSAAISCTI